MVQQELFSLALGLVPPWLVDDVTFKVEDKRLDLHVIGMNAKIPPGETHATMHVRCVNQWTTTVIRELFRIATIVQTSVKWWWLGTDRWHS